MHARLHKTTRARFGQALLPRSPLFFLCTLVSCAGVLAGSEASATGSRVDLEAPAPTYASGATALAVGRFGLDDHLDLLTGFGVSLGDGSGEFPLPFPFSNAAVDIGDFNGDGLLDFVGILDDQAFLHRGNSLGGFVREELFFPGVLARGLTSADFDGDGARDLAITRGHADPTSDRVTLLFNDGDGQVEGVFQLESHSNGFDLLALDLDADDHVDLVHLYPRGIEVFWGNGTRSLPPREPLTSFDVERATCWLSADWNGDGRPDLAVGLDSGAVAFFPGLGDRSVGERRDLLTPVEPAGLAAGDLDRDGDLDLVVAGGRGGASFLGTGTFEFGSPQIYRALGEASGKIALGDFDENGLLDLVGLGDPGDYFARAAVLRGDGRGGFGGGVHHPAPQPARIAAGDLDGDGAADLAVGTNSGSVRIVYGDGSGGIAEQRILVSEETPRAVALGDFNGDGRADLAAAHYSPENVSVFPGLPDREFAQAQTFPVPGLALSVTVGDFDEDDLDDLIVQWPDHFAVARSLGDGSFDVLEAINVQYRAQFDRPVVADLDEDGHLDVFVFGRTGGSTDSILVYLGDGTGSLALGPSYAAFSREGFVTADFNEDGHLDIVVHGTIPGTNGREGLEVLLGDGTGALVEVEEILFDQLESPRRAITGDFDADGHEDLLFSGRHRVGGGVLLGNDARIYVGDGAGSFTKDRRFGLGLCEFVAAADLDGDGFLDVIASNDFETAIPGEDRISILRNRTGDVLSCRRGSVNAGLGPATDVLFVNETAGMGPERLVALSPEDPLRIRIEQPPSATQPSTGYVVYVRFGSPRRADVVPLPFGLGAMCLVSPLNGLTPDLIANSIGRARLLGTTDWPFPVARAPHVLVDVPQVGETGRFLVQGLIIDSASPGGQAGVTNAVEVHIE